ncbi:uncharacterized protein AMSG_10375 [Thecamonas trahens ATCC 50062]|uniref:Uncharacterized protein n=1 Tax=Thecamonas trahens ATCC 50062 TaxID=461836 RepID=A0A0L0DQE4_THETB|nr:hypothetical protein AMSG_10375 [Thecamonas trahens ATCC 50062]KNC54529.1 hypothetical protein AMSG_10375 [Thecamonas trahens ATCC 50062]|eukprot:XP_013753546.1 hypothetical protein AMSG_10375 [Thecamonas trahens ATCC 50062]
MEPAATTDLTGAAVLRAASAGDTATVAFVLGLPDKVRAPLLQAASPLAGTVLHAAALGGHAAVVAALAGADGVAVDGRDGRGETALHVAAWRGHVAAVHELLRAGASRRAVNDDGEWPVDLAARTPRADDAARSELLAMLNVLPPAEWVASRRKQ